MSLEGTVRDFCRKEGFPLKAGDRVLCAVSGGTDSMALLHYLWKLGCQVTAATFHHGIRPNAEKDVRFVEGWCREREIPCVIGRGDVPEAAQAAGETVEEAARRLRYAFLEETAQRVGADYIATAHNADDQAETVLLRLLRGTGLKGLGGIPPRRDRIIRPFLSVTREEIEDYCKENNIPHREDETNTDTAYTRNFLRHEVMPLLRSRNPNLSTTLSRTAESLRQDEAYLNRQTDRAAETLLVRERERISIPVQDLLTLPEPIALRLLGRMGEELTGGEVIFSHDQRRALLALARSEDPSAKLSLPFRLQGKRLYDMLTLSCEETGQKGFAPVFLEEGSSCHIPELGLTVRCEKTICPEKPGRETIYLSPGWKELTIRPRKEGDRFQMPDRPEKRLKKLFMEAKIPKEQREQIPVLEIGGEIAAVFGFGAGSSYQAMPGKEAWKIMISNQK